MYLNLQAEALQTYATGHSYSNTRMHVYIRLSVYSVVTTISICARNTARLLATFRATFLTLQCRTFLTSRPMRHGKHSRLRTL